MHVKSVSCPKAFWDTFKNLYEDKSLGRQIGLLRQLISVRLEKKNSMQDYINEIKNASYKLADIGTKIDDKLIGAILLGGLTDEYRPLILGIEASGIEITSDNIIRKLCDNRIDEISEGESSAFLGQKRGFKSKFNKKWLKCFACGKKGIWLTCAEAKETKAIKIIPTMQSVTRSYSTKTYSTIRPFELRHNEINEKCCVGYQFQRRRR